MALCIRPAKATDCVGAADVVREVYEEYGFTWDEGDYHADLYDLQGYYLDQGHLFWLAFDGDEAVGTVALERFPSLPGPAGSLTKHVGFVRIGGADCALQRLYVRPTARKGGIGTALMQTVIDHAKASECHLMEIWSDKRFAEAHRLYERFGAKLVGDRICHDPDQSPEWGLSLSF